MVGSKSYDIKKRIISIHVKHFILEIIHVKHLTLIVLYGNKYIPSFHFKIVYTPY